MIEQIFTQARSGKIYTDAAMTQADIHALYEIAKWAPSESNTCPMRLVFAHSDEAKARLRPGILPGNQPKFDSAPVTAIVAFDTEFDQHLATLAPHLAESSPFADMPTAKRSEMIQRSAHLQAGMFIAAARAQGWTAGPMAGIDRDAIDQAFFAESSWRCSFVVMLGVADESGFYPRGARLSFEQACQIL